MRNWRCNPQKLVEQVLWDCDVLETTRQHCRNPQIQMITPQNQSSNQQTRSSQSCGQPKQNKQVGRTAPTSQGYSETDCITLVATIKQILPLASQEWGKFQEIYNQYAINNNQMSRDINPLKIKFQSLVDEAHERYSIPTVDL
ncbi:uncharacterized protein VP01_1223g2 [Puccinia sorghi]|uniref:Uncharacterized protein n=1 Tax=Puccinia sorghi TaxID=27349 RepID=A0A0L6VRH1_9BASI|nr:uncharacterized protein VP01_1223g2 [Puccinia sorghi]